MIKLAKEGHTTRQIAEIVHISLKDIGAIKRRYIGEEETEAETNKHLSINSRAFKLFKENRNMVDVAINLNLDAQEVLDLHNDYLRLLNKNSVMSIYFEMGDEIYMLVWLFDNLKRYGLANKKDIHIILQQEEKIKNLDKELFDISDEIGRLNSFKMQLGKEVAEIMEMWGHCESVRDEKD